MLMPNHALHRDAAGRFGSVRFDFISVFLGLVRRSQASRVSLGR